MIKTSGEARQMPCIMKLDNWEGSCGSHECLAWKFFWDDFDAGKGITPTHGKKDHGKGDMNKRGFCGFVGN
jgi:hypothetical protein